MTLAIKRIHNLLPHLSYVSTLPDITRDLTTRPTKRIFIYPADIIKQRKTHDNKDITLKLKITPLAKTSLISQSQNTWPQIILIVDWLSRRCVYTSLTGTLTPQSNGPLYSNAVIDMLAVDGWAVTFGTARRA